ncbi:MAG: UvrB/UvrC motif-containing protein [Thermoleophilaceae bacterium]
MRAADDMVEQIDHIEFVVTQSEAEAFLAEQNFIRQYRPRFNVRLRDDKSYPFIAISLDEDFPRVYFTRERHRRSRAYFGPFSNAKRVRETLDLLGKVFQYRTCEGTEPGRASGSPCLDYFIKRCQAPCVGYASKEEYRRGIDSIVAFLSGRYRQIERDLEAEMHDAADAQEFEQAALLRNRLKAVRSLLERQRIANEGVGTLDAIAVAAEGGDANAQVFQVRDGVLADRQSFYLENAGERPESEVAEEFILQYYATSPAIPPQVMVPAGPRGARRTRGRPGRAPRRRGRDPSRGARRQATDLRARPAQRAPRPRPGPPALRAPAQPAHRGPRGTPGGARHRRGAHAHRVLRHIEPGGDPHRRLDGRARGRRAPRSPTTAGSASATPRRTTSRP